jgi:hypothetical protein
MELETIDAEKWGTKAASDHQLPKSAAHYIVAALALASVIVMVIAFVRWLRTQKTLPRKWLWLLAIWIGVGGIAFNWSTGTVEALKLGPNLLLLGISLTQDSHGAWILGATMPLGAGLFLYKRRETAPHETRSSS